MTAQDKRMNELEEEQATKDLNEIRKKKNIAMYENKGKHE